MIAYYCLNLMESLYITRIVYDCDDYVEFFVSNNDTGQRSKLCKSRVNYTAWGVPYFIHNKRRVYLDECKKIK